MNAKMLYVLFAALLSGSFALAAPPEGYTALFDGKTFAGWEGNQEIFRIEEGAIVGGSLKRDKIDHNEFLCTERQFENFELRLKFKVLGKGANAGVQFRTKRIPDHFEVSGYQADLGDGWWGALYDESRRKKALAKPDNTELEKVLNRDDWNDYVIRCEGPRVQLWINGYQTVDYTEEDKAIERTGVIAVQIHGGPPSEAHYKELYLKELK